MAIKTALFLLCVVAGLASASEKSLRLKFKGNTTLDCSELQGSVTFFGLKHNETEPSELHINNTKLKYSLNEDGKILTINDLNKDTIKNIQYSCKSSNDEVIKFKSEIAPHVLIPEKPSQTVTEGGNVKLKCSVLYGNETSFEWRWETNGTQIKNDTKYEILSEESDTFLRINKVSYDDKGFFKCVLKNEFGEHEQEIQLRVKGALDALWPFLGVLAEVIVLCLIILIYEKKCAKKPSRNEEENEQAQNLMGKDENSDIKKRTARA